MSSWMCTVDWPKAVGVAKDLILAGAAVVTARAAVKGISKWRAEEQGKADFDLARRALHAVFRFQSTFQRARSVFTSASEFPDGYDAIGSTAEQKSDAWAHVFRGRLDKAYAAVTDLDAIAQEMDALWGDETKSHVDRLFGCYSTLRASMELYVRNARDPRIFERNPQLREKVDADVFDLPTVDGNGQVIGANELTERLKGAVKDGAAELRQRLPMHRPPPETTILSRIARNKNPKNDQPP